MKKVLGIDVGGTKIASGLVDKNYHVSQVSVVATSQTDVLGQIMGLIEDYRGFSAIGLGMPGQVLSSGLVTRLGNIPWKPLNLRNLVSKRTKKSVSVINDAKAFALAEAMIGSGKKYRSVAGIILGTGIGVGMVMDKKVYFGKDGIAGELEHTVLLDGKMLRDHRHMAGKFRHAKNTVKFLKTLFGMVVLSFNPDVIVLGGAWSKLPGMERVANSTAVNLGNYINRTPVKISKLKYAGIIGAAMLLLKRK